MKFRRAHANDCLAIADVHVEGWRTTYRGLMADEYLDGLSAVDRAREWEQSIARDDVHVWVAEVDDEGIVAFAASGPEHTGNYDFDSELYAIYMRAHWRGRGLGKLLVAHNAQSLLSAGHHGMMVWVLAENANRRFYEALGGQRFAEGDYQAGQQSLVEVAYGWKDLATLAVLAS